MISIRRDFENEQGKKISLLITRDQRGVTIEIFGPDSQVEHTYTQSEAMTIRALLQLLEPAYKKPTTEL